MAWWGAAVLVCAAVVPALAQQTAGTGLPRAANNPYAGMGNGTATGPGIVRRPMSKYLLGPLDEISVTVERFPDYGVPRVVIPPDGKISLPFFGAPLQANGKTTRQLEIELTRRLGTRIRNPRISVSLTLPRNSALGYVYVVGSVQSQGTIDIYEGYRLTEVLAKVGGTTGRLDEVKANLSRAGKLYPLDLYGAVSRPQSEANMKVKPDDVITVQNVDPGRIAVNGDITKPGVYDLRRAPQANANEVPLRPRLLDLIVAAGGFGGTEKTQEGRMTGFVQRGNQQIALRVQDAVDYKDPTANIALHPGDFVTFKYELPLSIDVFGEVRAPGNYRVPPGANILQAISVAGGPTRAPEQLKATLQRNGQTQNIDMARIFAGDINANVSLRAGDVLQLNAPDTIRVSVSGAVGQATNADRLYLPLDATVYDALASAGGLAKGLTPSKARITVVRRTESGKRIFFAVDAQALLEQRDPSQDARLQNGDLVSVVEAKERSATISGEIQKPGPLDVPDGGQDIASFIARAGGQTPEASLRNVTIKRRNGRVQTVDAYDAVANGKSLGADGLIQDGDYVVIGENQQKVYVAEAVNRPGLIPLPEGRTTTVLEAIGAAGSVRPGARTQEVALVRMGANNQPQVTLLNLRDLKAGKLAGANQIVRAGDVIVVPEGKYKQSPFSQLGNVFGLLNIARSVAGF